MLGGRESSPVVEAARIVGRAFFLGGIGEVVAVVVVVIEVVVVVVIEVVLELW